MEIMTAVMWEVEKVGEQCFFGDGKSVSQSQFCCLWKERLKLNY